MHLLSWLERLAHATYCAGHRKHRAQRTTAATDVLEARQLLAIDLGDAPDTTTGSGPGNYSTLLADGGPSHVVLAGLRLGATVDTEPDAAPNFQASGDDNTGSADDEDGVVNSIVDLRITVGSQPHVTLRATNLTGFAAILAGWIDMNGDGVFDNATERTLITVPTGTNNGLFTLSFPVVSTTFTGTSYARFRISTDPAGANSTGPAADGEIEDYAVSILKPSPGSIQAGGSSMLYGGIPNLPALGRNDAFGASIANLGDIDADGVSDLAVGAPYSGGQDDGATYILRMNANGTVKASTMVVGRSIAPPGTSDNISFGRSLAGLGDLDGDGVPDLAVGALYANAGGRNAGSVYILFLNADGTVKATSRLANGTPNLPALTQENLFGSALANLGDLDGDGITDLAVGARGDHAIYLLNLNSNGTIRAAHKLANGTPHMPPVGNDPFGLSLANLGDVNGDGIQDLAVGTLGPSRSRSIYLLFLDPTGGVRSAAVITRDNTPELSDMDNIGIALANAGDLDGDGICELLVSDSQDNAGGLNSGALLLLHLTRFGTVRGIQKLAHGSPNMPELHGSDYFSSAIASLGDLDGDGLPDLAVGAPGDDRGGINTGALYLLRLNSYSAPTALSLSETGIAENQPAGTIIGQLTATDVDSGDRFTFSLVAGAGDGDNSHFTIDGNQLRAAHSFNFETQSHYSVRIRVTDLGGQSIEQSFTITVTDTSSTDTAQMLRAYNPNADYHFFTISPTEFAAAVQAGYRDESHSGTGFRVYTVALSYTTPVYRLYNIQTGHHYYTTSLAERDYLASLVPPPETGPDTRKSGWRDEKVEGLVSFQALPGTREIYRLYNTNSGVHFYTEEPAVRDAVLAIMELVEGQPTGRHPWQLHSSIGYALPLDTTNSMPAPASVHPPLVNLLPTGVATETPIQPLLSINQSLSLIAIPHSPAARPDISSAVEPSTSAAFPAMRARIATITDPDEITRLDDLWTDVSVAGSLEYDD